MRREELFEILGQIDDRFIIPARRERKVIHWNHYVGVAAALCVIVGGVWFLLHMEGSGIGLRPGMTTDPTVVTTAPTDPTQESTEPTNESTQPTTETTAPTETEPTESTESQEDYALRASLYNLNPDGFFSFVYDGIRQPYQGNGPELDVSQLQVGYRYVHDQKENKVYQISNSPLAEHDGTPITWPTVDYLYFVESDDPATVVRTDYYGQNRTAIYHSEYEEVTCLRYYGVDPQGKLVLVENTNRVIMYDIPTGEIEVIMEQPYIRDAIYITHNTELPYIQWHGKREGDSKVEFYLYYPSTGEYDKKSTNTETDPTESTESQEDYGLRASLYNLNPDGFFSFVYDGIRQPYQGNGPELDVSQLQVGYRYVHDQKEDKVYQISDSPLAEHDGTPVTWPTVDYLYFVESDDPATVVRTDYYGQNRTAIYHSEYGEVTCLRYYGVDPQGKLVLVENTNRVIMYDIPTGEIEVIMEQPYICYANYTTRYTELPYIQWSGKREGDSEVKLYTYYPDTGEYIELDPL